MPLLSTNFAQTLSARRSMSRSAGGLFGQHHVGVLFVPHQQAWVMERFGRFDRILASGLNFAIPGIETVAYRHSLKVILLALKA